MYNPDAVKDNANVWLLPDRDAVYETNSLVDEDGFEFDINATGSLNWFKLIILSNSSFTASTAVETTPAVNVETDATVENLDDGILELVAVITLFVTRSILGPKIEEDGKATKVAFLGSFQTIFTELVPVETKPTSTRTALPTDTFNKIEVLLVNATCPDMVMETEWPFETEDEKKCDPEDVMVK